MIDDDGRQGEHVRLRESRTTIGRVEADVLLPHDDQVSGTHAEIVREFEDGVWIWEVRDLNSTNGLFVKCLNVRLRNHSEILLGMHRYRFQFPQSGGSESTDSVPGMPPGTRGWQAVPNRSISNLVPCLVAMPETDPIQQYALTKNEHVIGRDAQRATLVIDDPMLSPAHAVLSKAPDGTWQLSDQGSLNGIWLRVQKTLVTSKCEFQLGEQRLQLKLP